MQPLGLDRASVRSHVYKARGVFCDTSHSTSEHMIQFDKVGNKYLRDIKDISTGDMVPHMIQIRTQVGGARTYLLLVSH